VATFLYRSTHKQALPAARLIREAHSCHVEAGSPDGASYRRQKAGRYPDAVKLAKKLIPQVSTPGDACAAIWCAPRGERERPVAYVCDKRVRAGGKQLEGARRR
jgi:hypothetical protein